MKKLLLGLLFLVGSQTGFAQEAINCQNLAAGAFAMAQASQEDGKLVTPVQLLEAVGVEKKTLKDHPEAAKLVTLVARMVLTPTGRETSPEEHMEGAGGLCESLQGNIKEMNEYLEKLLQHYEAGNSKV